MQRKHLLVGLFLIGLLAAIVVVNGVKDFWFHRGVGEEAVTMTVDEGDTLSSMLPELEEQLGVRPFWLKLYARISGNDRVRPGTYGLDKQASYEELMRTLSMGSAEEVSITIPEGFSLEQIGARVRESFPYVSEAEWNLMTGMESPLESHAFIIAAEKPDNVDLEGYLFPDTYRFFADADAEEIVTQMIDTMSERAWAVGLTTTDELPRLHDALTLASVVEKEVRQPETMANVAHIFMKRLAIGMPLQSDATINYIIKGDDPSPTLDDLQVESQYNTYKYPGLPPGPISSPGINALSAVADPAENPYYYFLTTDDGRIYYAQTHDEHVANKAQYLY